MHSAWVERSSCWGSGSRNRQRTSMRRRIACSPTCVSSTRVGGWHIQGALSCAHWLAWRVGWDLVTARERVRVACKLGELPTVDDALRRELRNQPTNDDNTMSPSDDSAETHGHAAAATNAPPDAVCVGDDSAEWRGMTDLSEVAAMATPTDTACSIGNSTGVPVTISETATEAVSLATDTTVCPSDDSTEAHGYSAAPTATPPGAMCAGDDSTESCAMSDLPAAEGQDFSRPRKEVEPAPGDLVRDMVYCTEDLHNPRVIGGDVTGG